MPDSLLDMLTVLYPDSAEETLARVRVLIENVNVKRPRALRSGRRFSERDVVLICYADHVHAPGKSPLQALDDFLLRYARGAVSCVHILPFFPYSSDDGFSVIDYGRVNDRFGDWADVACIADHFDLMVDLVINHVSAGSVWFRRFLAGDERYRRFFLAFDRPVDVSAVFRPRTHPLLTPFSTAFGEQYVWTTFSADQIDVNFSNAEVLLEYIRIMLLYLEQGATVIRLDAIAYLWKELGTSCLHLPQTHMVVRLLRRILEEVAPGVWIITETNVPHSENISYFGNGDDEAHLVYNFALPPLLLYSFLTADARELTRWARTVHPPSEDTTFFNFTASHDGIGVTALRALISPHEFQRVLDAVLRRGGRISFRDVPGRDPVPYELNIAYLDAVGGGEPFIASQAIALAFQGVPAIYFSSLVGANNWEEGVERLGYNRAINREKFEYADLSRRLDDPSSIEHTIYLDYLALLRARAAEPAFSPHAEQRVLEIHPQVFAVLRSDGTDSVLALTSVTDQSIALDGAALRDLIGASGPVDLITGQPLVLDDGLHLGPYEVRWLK